MRKKISLIVFFLFLFPISSYALDLDANNLYPNIIKSLQDNEDGWFIHGNDLIYAKPSDVKHLQEMSYPDHDMRAIVVMSYSMFYNGGYISMEKPLKEYPPDRHEALILREIKIRVMQKLHDEGIRLRGKPVVKQQPIEEPVQPKSDGEMKKFEAKGRKI